MSKLSPEENKTIEKYWMNINDYRERLKFREWKLLYDHKETDENIGGGRSNRISDTTADKAIILAEDERYQHLKKIVCTVDSLYKELDHDLKTIVDMRYWCKTEIYEWEDIADKLYMSRNKVLRKRNLLIDETAKRLGWM